MKGFLFLLLLLLSVGGCRFSMSAEKLQVNFQVDESGYLGKDDPALYTDEPAIETDRTE